MWRSSRNTKKKSCKTKSGMVGFEKYKIIIIEVFDKCMIDKLVKIKIYFSNSIMPAFVLHNLFEWYYSSVIGIVDVLFDFVRFQYLN